MTVLPMFLRTIAMGCVCGKDTLYIQNNKYTVQERLGEGGFSVIDLVRDSQTHRLHALKRLLCHSPVDEQNGLQEAEYMNVLRHPNLVPCVAHAVRQILKHRTAISEVLIVMPFYQKGSLFDEVESLRAHSARMKETRIISLLRGICLGLIALHTLAPTPLAHRDVKPHNVMLEAGDSVDDIPVLMDFGSMGPARHQVTTSAQAAILQDLASEKCSMPYRAPELFHVDSHCTIDESLDIWSLGCTLYAMCFYESPFDKVHQRGDSIALAAMAGNIKVPHTGIYSEELMRLMLRMLSVSSRDRPTAQQILNSLVNLQSNSSEVQPSFHPPQLHTSPPVKQTTSVAISSFSANFRPEGGGGLGGGGDGGGGGADVGRLTSDTLQRL